MSQKTIIIGGVAGGASAAARLRRLDENAEILVLERGPYVSFANCGLPYRVGELIKSDDDLLLASPGLFRDRFKIEVRTGNEVRSIDTEGKTVSVRDLSTGEDYSESYDNLVLAPGAKALRPPIPGIDLPGVFSVRTIPDAREIQRWIAAKNADKAVVVGGGFIGLEMAENLKHLGLEVTLVEMLDQVMPPMDAEMTRPLEKHMSAKGVRLALGDGVSSFTEAADGKLSVQTQSGAKHEADIVILAIGVQPETSLAQAAGIDLGERGGILVDDRMRTSKPDIYAVGDAVEKIDTVSGQSMLLALAGPANRQGRIVADNIAGRDSRFRGVQGTSICGVFDMAIGSTGLSEKALQRLGVTNYRSVYLHPAHHVGYYPGAETLHMKLIFDSEDGKILGAQVTGKTDVARKLDVIATYIQMGGTVYDLEEAELAYAPQFGAAKDAVNLAGMLAANTLRGDHFPVSPTQAIPEEVTLLDVREAAEWDRGHLEGAVHIPLGSLRDSLDKLAKDQPVWVYCHVGKRGYDAQRMLRQHGYEAYNMSGGWLSWGERVILKRR
ncbi:FAD-dependent oxidoreductase [Pelagicoccus mobilis]|uniref:FAD-dependent oxidoreductase n=1 Tax=Pelagicoccus mobilis TaxID=415221 RepID=A0A934VTP0_9BACT|nr:FAD-dependent oxidoreductase [Pelagicoccus mobilis]MBK1879923.1 FAD-dependent oxidoreductase [Pelagicoccus mobilis]